MKLNKRVVVSGGGRGIGREISRTLLLAGFDVHAISSNQSVLESAATELEGLPGSFHFSVVDLRDRDGINKFVGAWDSDLYGIVNNAAMNIPTWISDPEVTLQDTMSRWDEVMQVNLSAPLMLCKGLLHHVSRPGRIVNIASQLGHEGRVAYGAYCASKWGLIGLTKSLAKELGPSGITVNAVSPGWVRTELHEKKLHYYAKRLGDVSLEAAERDIVRRLELQRFNTMDEVANVVKFLLSEDAKGVTGRSWLMSSVYSHE